MCICIIESQKEELYFLKFSNVFLPLFLNVLWTSNNNTYEIQNFKYICVGYKININRNLSHLNY